MKAGAIFQADEYYLQARDDVTAAVRELDGKCKKFRTPGGVSFGSPGSRRFVCTC